MKGEKGGKREKKEKEKIERERRFIFHATIQFNTEGGRKKTGRRGLLGGGCNHERCSNPPLLPVQSCWMLQGASIIRSNRGGGNPPLFLLLLFFVLSPSVSLFFFFSFCIRSHRTFPLSKMALVAMSSERNCGHTSASRDIRHYNGGVSRVGRFFAFLLFLPPPPPPSRRWSKAFRVRVPLTTRLLPSSR